MFVYVLCVCKRKEKKKNHRNLKFERHLGTIHEDVCAVMGIITIVNKAFCITMHLTTS